MIEKHLSAPTTGTGTKHEGWYQNNCDVKVGLYHLSAKTDAHGFAEDLYQISPWI